MRLYGAIEKVEAQSDGTVRVYGIATSEAVDEQGEIVRAAAMRAAMPDYMRFPALREMHQLSAAGTTLDAEVCEDGTTRIVAHVVDPVAVAKVKSQVYRGFSIGGRVTQRDIANPKVITGLVLNEISLVDRPANPEAIFDCWKAADDGKRLGKMPSLLISKQTGTAQGPFNSPIQIWACGVSDHRHLTKAEAVKCLEECETGPADLQTQITSATAGMLSNADTSSAVASRKNSVERDDRSIEYADPGYQPDGKERYPIDTDPHIRAAWNYINKPGNARKYTSDQLRRIRAAVIAAWKGRIDKDGPPSAGDSEKAPGAVLAKALWDFCRVARILIDLDWLRTTLDLSAAIENDTSQKSARLREIIAELCDSLAAVVIAETDELSGDAGRDGPPLASAMPEMLAMTVGASGVQRIAALLDKGGPVVQNLAANLVSKAKPSRADQALMDMAYRACDEYLKTAGLSSDEIESMVKARDHLQKAGAIRIPDWTAVTAAINEDFVPGCGGFPDHPSGSDTAKVLDVIAAPAGKRGQANQCLINVAHGCLSELTDGMLCGEMTKIGVRHSKETMQHLEAAHYHLVAAGAKCASAAGAASDGPSENCSPGTELVLGKRGCAEDVAQMAAESGEKAALVKVLGEVVPMLEQLTRRVDEIARTPLPPLTIAKNATSVSKRQDANGTLDSAGSELSPEAVAGALSKMSKEEQTLTLIKASYAKPIRIPGATAEEG
jgi:hypothetical protein